MAFGHGSVAGVYDVTFATFNFSNPQSAIAEVLKNCKGPQWVKQMNLMITVQNCGVQVVFSASVDKNTGEFLKERCIRVISWKNPSFRLV